MAAVQSKSLLSGFQALACLVYFKLAETRWLAKLIQGDFFNVELLFLAKNLVKLKGEKIVCFSRIFISTDVMSLILEFDEFGRMFGIFM